MRLETIALQGVTRFHDPVALDVRTLPEGLIAIVGQNGEGKTTLLESVPACLWRQFPSRGEKGLVDYVTRRDSHLEVVFTIDGQGTFRARLALDAVTRQSEAVLEQILDSGERRILNDGKVSTYDAVIARHLPPPELILASVFAAQNRAGSFTSQDRKARKQLFASLLGLDHYEAMATTARDAVKLVEDARTRATAMRDVLRAQASPALGDQIVAEATALQTEMATVELRKAKAEAQVPALQAARETLAVALQRHAMLSARRSALAAEIGALTVRKTAVPQQLAMRTRAHQDASAKLAAAHVEALRVIDERLANNRAVMANAAQIREAVAQVTSIEGDLAAAREALTKADAVVTTARDAAQTSTSARERLEHELSTLRDAEKVAALLTTVPCQGAGDFAGCALIANARQAREKLEGLPDLEARIVRARDHQRTHLLALDAAVEARNTADALVYQLTQNLAPQRKLAGLSDRLAAADARLTELVQQRDAEVARYTTASTDAVAAHADLFAAANADLAEIDVKLDALDRDQAGIDLEIESIGDVPLQARDLDRQWQAVQDERTACAALWATLAQRRLDIGRRRADLTRATQRLAQVETWLSALDTELLAWQRLAKALGRDGLPVLEIDAAGPTVSTYCNDLLQSCFGGRFSVELITQEAKASGKGLKETFEIRVFDNETGGDPRDLGDLSGGERTIIDEALKNAIAILLNQRAPWPIRTCWRDETTGALDPENARRYIDMLKRMREIAGIVHVFFVTHLPDAAALADAQVVVANGQLTVRHAPYPAAA